MPLPLEPEVRRTGFVPLLASGEDEPTMPEQMTEPGCKVLCGSGSVLTAMAQGKPCRRAYRPPGAGHR